MKNVYTKLVFMCLFSLAFSGYGQWTESGASKATITRALATNGNVIFAGTDDGMFRSVNNGASWTAINNGLTKDTVLSIVVMDSSVFIGTLHSGVFQTTNNGNSWYTKNNGLPRDSLDPQSFCSINSFSKSGGTVVAGIFQKGVFVSKDNGTSWASMNTGLTNLNVTSLITSGNNIFSGTGLGGGIFLSSNAGTTWTKANSGLIYIRGMVYSVLSLLATDNNLFAVTLSGGIYSSKNNGISWVSANSGLSTNNIFSLFSYSNNLFAGTDLNGVFVSSNNGSSWTGFSGGLPETRAVLCFCVSQGTLFAAVYGEGVWKRQLLDEKTNLTSVTLQKKLKGSISASSGILRYTVPADGLVSIKYYNLEGKLLASLVNHSQNAGNYAIGMPVLPKGFYIQDFRAGDFTQKDRVN